VRKSFQLLRIYSTTFYGTGHSIEKDVQKFIFDPFYTTRGKQGKELGLSVYYDIIKKHGGQISIESEPNVGSTVTLILPIKQKI
jgi:two-component system, NtrC family, sensor kinase